VVALLVEAGCRELLDPHVTRVETGDESLDRAALPARVPALEDHEQRRPDLVVVDLTAEREPQRQQALLPRVEAGLLLLGGQPERQIEVVEAAHSCRFVSSRVGYA
jgi:hypothetical protein